MQTLMADQAYDCVLSVKLLNMCYRMCITVLSYAKMRSNTQRSTSTLTTTVRSSAYAPIQCAHDSQALVQKVSVLHQAQSQMCTMPYPHKLCSTAAAAESNTGVPGLSEVTDMSNSPHHQGAGSNLAMLFTACYSYHHVCLACAEVRQDATPLLCVCSWQNDRLPN